MFKRILGAIYFTFAGIFSVATVINVIIALIGGYRGIYLFHWFKLTPVISYFTYLGIALLMFLVSIFLTRINPFKTDIEKEKEEFLKK